MENSQGNIIDHTPSEPSVWSQMSDDELNKVFLCMLRSSASRYSYTAREIEAELHKRASEA